MRRYSSTSRFLFGVGTGVGLMFFLDPGRGRSRRARASDLARHYFSCIRIGGLRAARDSWHRAQGLVARSLSRERRPLTATLIHERVRTRLGRLVSHPHAVGVEVFGRKVRLSGPVLAAEVVPLLRGVAAVTGVSQVENALEPHATNEHIPSLQGGRRRVRSLRLAPGIQLGLGTAGLLLLTVAGRRARLALGLSAIIIGGIKLTARAPIAAKNREDEERDIGWSPRESRAEGEINFYREFRVMAPVGKTYRFWSDLERLPAFVSHLDEVTPVGPGRFRWKIQPKSGSPIEWDAQITREVPNQLLSWRSEPSAPLCQSGMIHLEAHPLGGTRVHLRVIYQVPEKAPTNFKATDMERLFGPRPQRVFEEDCQRIKNYLEKGVPPQDSAEHPAVGE